MTACAAGFEVLPDLLCSESHIPADSPPEKISKIEEASFHNPAVSSVAQIVETPPSNLSGRLGELASSKGEAGEAGGKASPSGQDATPEGLLASSNKPGIKDGGYLFLLIFISSLRYSV